MTTPLTIWAMSHSLYELGPVVERVKAALPDAHVKEFYRVWHIQSALHSSLLTGDIPDAFVTNGVTKHWGVYGESVPVFYPEPGQILRALGVPIVSPGRFTVPKLRLARALARTPRPRMTGREETTTLPTYPLFFLRSTRLQVLRTLCVMSYRGG